MFKITFKKELSYYIKFAYYNDNINHRQICKS